MAVDRSRLRTPALSVAKAGIIPTRARAAAHACCRISSRTLHPLIAPPRMHAPLTAPQCPLGTGPPGFISLSKGSTSCDAEGCPSGQFYNQHDEGSCQKCELGTYKSTTGIAECSVCGEGRTTVTKGATSEDDCVCPKEFLTDGNGECLQCASSMICDTANTTVLSLR